MQNSQILEKKFSFLERTVPFQNEPWIEDFEERGSVQQAHNGIDFNIHRILLSDQSSFEIQVFKPKKLSSSRDNLTVTYTTPWCTGLEGFNTDIGSEIASLGLPVVAVGPERSSSRHIIRNLGRVALGHQPVLEHDAKAHHLILDFLGTLQLAEVDKIINFGYSRGAMIGIGLNAMAEEHRRSIVYNALIDPCLASRPELKDLKVCTIGRYLLNELGSTVQEISALPKEDYAHLLKSASLDPNFWLQQVITGIGMFKGESGQFMSGIPEDSFLDLTFFSKSIFNQFNIWINSLSTQQFLKVRMQEGYHTGGINPDVWKPAIGRIALVNRLYGQGVRGQDLYDALN